MAHDLLTADLASERALAVQSLLAAPLLDVVNDRSGFTAVVRHHVWLVEWFETTCGWHVTVDIASGFARLDKRASSSGVDTTRPLRRRRGSRQPFDRRRYQLLCLVAAELVQHPVTTVGRLAQAVTAEAHLDTSRHGERAALVDVLLVLMSWGALESAGGDIEEFVESQSANAVLHAQTTRLHRLLASTVSPSSLGDDVGVSEAITALRREPRYGTVDTDAEDGRDPDDDRRLRHVRHQLGRRVLDDPATYLDELTPSEQGYLENPSGRSWLRARVDEAGFEFEERSDGFLAVDAGQRATDIAFPGPHGNAHQLALLLVDALLVSANGLDRHVGALTAGELDRAVDAIFERFPNWARAHRDSDGRRALAGEAIDVLVAMKLAVRLPDGGLLGRPAVARYRVGDTRISAVPEPSLFDLDTEMS